MSSTDKEKKKSRHRALVKVVLFIVRVQKSQKKKQKEAEEKSNFRPDVVPLLRCSTLPTLPIFLPGGPSGMSAAITSPTGSHTLSARTEGGASSSIIRYASHRSTRDSNHHWQHYSSSRSQFRQPSLMSIYDDEDERHLPPFLATTSNVSPYSRSRASSSVSRCSNNSKNSGGSDSAGAIDEDGENADLEKRIARFVDFTTMNKPYTLNGCGELATSGTLLSSAGAKSAVKNITVTCNSVMGDPKKLSKKLIRRGSTAESRDERFTLGRPSTSGVATAAATNDGGSVAVQSDRRSRKEGLTVGKAPMLLRQQTADGSRSRPLLPRCTSDEHVASSGGGCGVGTGGVQSETDVSPQTGRKFVKRKSSADLLLTSTTTNEASNGGVVAYSSSTLDRLSGLAAGVMSASLTTASGGQLSKAEKKKLEKMKENMKQLLELFTAVEQDDIGKVRSMLQHGDVDANATNSDDLSLLDVATMLNHTEVSLLLLKHGAQENQRLSTVTHRSKHLQSLIDVAQSKLAELSLKQAGSSMIGSTATMSKSLEKQTSSWESRLHTLKKMRNNLENAASPSKPKNVTLNVSSCTSLSITFEPPDPQPSGVVVTKYKVEWSQHDDFHEIEGSICIYDLRRLEATISGLRSGATYFVRVSAGMYKGFGEAASSEPVSASPSSWRDIDRTSRRGAGRLEAITDLFHELRKLKKTDLWERIAYTGDSALKKKKHSAATLKSFFSSNIKFQRNLKRGVYLASILYKDDKILCTVDDCLPVVEVDESVPTPLGPDFQWFMKLSCAWDDMRSLNFDADLANQSPSLLFRLKLLEAAASMQAGLGVQDLGRLHSTPLVDSKGVTVFVTVQYVQDSKAVQGLAVRWSNMNKILKKQSAAASGEKEHSAMDLLINGLLNFLNFYESTYIPLDRGLYLGYVKLHTSINQISIVVPENLPSVLPFVFIRDNPHVSKEEWDWLRLIDINRPTANDDEDARPGPSSAQLAFHWSVASAARTLLNDLEVDDDQIDSHRIYRLEVVEIHSDVSFILLVPSHDDVCLPPGQSRFANGEERRGCVPLPVPMFEVAHLCTYQPDFIALYCRLSVFLEFYSVVLQQLHRQTLNEDEAKTYRQLLDILAGHQHRLEEVWKAARWISSVVTAARDRQLRSSLPLSILFSYNADSSVEMPKSLSSSSAPATNGASAQSFVRQCSEPEGGLGSSARKRRPATMMDTTEPAGPSGSTVAIRANGHRPPSAGRPRRVSSGEQSLSAEDQAEENSDVGYHSDQSVEKLANAMAMAAANADKESTTVTDGGGCTTAASNPTYDFPDNLFQNHHPASAASSGYVNCDSSKHGGGGSNEKTVLSAQNMDYFVDKLNFVQRTIPEKTSKLLEARYGKYEPSPPPPLPPGRPRIRSEEIRPASECVRMKQSPTIPAAITYRTEIVVGETGSDGGAPPSTTTPSSPAVFDVRFKSANPVRRHTHEYANLPPSPSPSPALSSPRRKSGCVAVPIFSSTTAAAPSDSEASCSSTSTVSSSRSQEFQHQHQRSWLSNDEENIPNVEDLSAIDKLYAEATSARLLPSSSASSVIVVRTPTPQLVHKPNVVVPSSRPTSSASSTRSIASSTASSTDRSSRIAAPTSSTNRSIVVQSPPQSGVLRVYAAYACGLAKGTSVKLHVTPRTTSHEVVVLVVRQLNKAVEMKGLSGPFYDTQEIETDFVLVAVIGARERCLRDDFPPLELQNPWCKGKLFVRRRNDLLAALEFGNEAKV